MKRNAQQDPKVQPSDSFTILGLWYILCLQIYVNLVSVRPQVHGTLYNYTTPGIIAEGYIVSVFQFVRSYVRS